MQNLTFVAADSIVEGGGLDTTRAADHPTIGLGGVVRGPIITIVRFLRIMQHSIVQITLMYRRNTNGINLVVNVKQ